MLRRLLMVWFALLVATPHALAARFPVDLQVYVCWGSAQTCTPANGLGYVFTLEQNGQGITSDGYDITWRWQSPTMQIDFAAWPNSSYTGRFRGNGCFSGTMSNRWGSVGTWSACRMP